jgi:guanine deaminase
VVAIRDACTRLGRFSLAGCSIYSSCEPCPLCLAAIDRARLDGIYHAATKADAAAIGFDDLEFYLVLTRSPEARRIRMQQALRDEANEVLQAWYRKPDRIPY